MYRYKRGYYYICELAEDGTMYPRNIQGFVITDDTSPTAPRFGARKTNTGYKITELSTGMYVSEDFISGTFEKASFLSNLDIAKNEIASMLSHPSLIAQAKKFQAMIQEAEALPLSWGGVLQDWDKHCYPFTEDKGNCFVYCTWEAPLSEYMRICGEYGCKVYKTSTRNGLYIAVGKDYNLFYYPNTIVLRTYQSKISLGINPSKKQRKEPCNLPDLDLDL